MSVDLRPDETWRISTAGRIGSLLTAALWLGLAVAVTAAGGPVAIAAVFWAGFALLCVLAWRCAFVPSLVLTSTELDVRNSFGRFSVPLDQITAAKVGYNGITLTTRDGRRVRAFAVQKSDLLRRMQRRTLGDQVVDAILTRATGVPSP